MDSHFHVKRASTPGLEDQSDSEDGSDSADGGSASLQLKILGELKKSLQQIRRCGTTSGRRWPTTTSGKEKGHI